MILGFGFVAVGYALFYWGWCHFPGQVTRYSLFTLIGFGNLFSKVTIPPGPPVRFQP